MSKEDSTRNERQRRWYQAHTEEKKALNLARYQANKAAGICVKCGQNDTIGGHVKCEECRSCLKNK